MIEMRTATGERVQGRESDTSRASAIMTGGGRGLSTNGLARSATRRSIVRMRRQCHAARART
eukprot:14412328-Alexandrium_andersonii.AAC.1